MAWASTRRRARRRAWSKGTWGWDVPGRRVWRPAFYAGTKAEVRLFEGYKPLKVILPAFRLPWRALNGCAGRRSGKSYNFARAVMRRISLDARRLLVDRDPFVRRSEWSRWLESIIGTARSPSSIARDVLEREKAPLHYWAVAPTYSLVQVMRREINQILRPWEDELGVYWVQQTVSVSSTLVTVTGSAPMAAVPT